jgi:hypothetical protein
MSPLMLPFGTLGAGGVPSGGNITQVGDYTVHTFLSTDVFKIPSGSYQVYYAVIAGGGGASNSFHGGGGGGAGGYLDGTTTLSAGSYLITVGAGGPGAPKVGDFSNSNGTKGSDSSIGNLIIATGGGAGITNSFNSIANGGSGGGGVNGGTGMFGTGISGQGNNGAGSGESGGFPFAGGGGGGAGQAGQAGQSRLNGGTGGNGKYSTIYPTTYYAGGGAGGKGTNDPSGTQTPQSVSGGLGGGGNSALTIGSDGFPGGINTGGGGGGAGGGWFSPRYAVGNGGNGGSGRVAIMYLTP